MTIALLSSSSSLTTARISTLSPPSCSKSHLTHKPYLVASLHITKSKRTHLSISPRIRATIDNGAGVVTTASPTVPSPEEKPLETPQSSKEEAPKLENKQEAVGPTGAVVEEQPAPKPVKKFQDPKWVNGTWDLKQFQKDGKTDWDAVIDAGEVFALVFHICIFWRRPKNFSLISYFFWRRK